MASMASKVKSPKSSDEPEDLSVSFDEFMEALNKCQTPRE